MPKFVDYLFSLDCSQDIGVCVCGGGGVRDEYDQLRRKIILTCHNMIDIYMSYKNMRNMTMTLIWVY